MSVSRSARKAETRQRIIDAALSLLASGRGLDGLGLREVAREAGLAATSIYNHFPDMEALGHALIDIACFRLRTTMRLGRGELVAQDPLADLQEVVDRFVGYLDNYEAELRLLVQQRLGGSVVYRRRLHSEIQLFIEELAEDVRTVSEHMGLPAMDYVMASEAAVSVMFGFGIVALELPVGKRNQGVERLVRQLEMIFLGSRAQASGIALGELVAKPEA